MYFIWRLCQPDTDLWTQTVFLSCRHVTRTVTCYPKSFYFFAAIRLRWPLPSWSTSERTGVGGAESGGWSVSGAGNHRGQIAPLARFWQTERRWQNSDTQTVSTEYEIIKGSTFTLRIRGVQSVFVSPNLHTWLHININAILITSCSRVLLEKLTGFPLAKKVPAFYGIRNNNTAFKVPTTCPYR